MSQATKSKGAFKAKLTELTNELKLVLQLTREMGKTDVTNAVCIQHPLPGGEFLTVTKGDLKQRQKKLKELVKELGLLHKESHTRTTKERSPLLVKIPLKIDTKVISFFNKAGHGDSHAIKEGFTSEEVLSKLFFKYIKEHELYKRSSTRKPNGEPHGSYMGIDELMESELKVIFENIQKGKNKDFDLHNFRQIEFSGIVHHCLLNTVDPILTKYHTAIRSGLNPTEAYMKITDSNEFVIKEGFEALYQKVKNDVKILEYEELIKNGKSPTEAYNELKNEDESIDRAIKLRMYIDEDMKMLGMV